MHTTGPLGQPPTGVAAGQRPAGRSLRIEHSQIHPVAQVPDPLRTTETHGDGDLDVFPVLRQGVVPELHSDALHLRPQAPLDGAHALVEKQAMDRVHDNGYPGDAGGQPPEEPRLEPVGMNDVEPLAPEKTDQFDEPASVSKRRTCGGRVARDLDRNPVLGGSVRRDPAAWRGHTVHLVPQPLEVHHLWPTVKAKANVDVREVHYFGDRHRDFPSPGRPSASGRDRDPRNITGRGAWDPFEMRRRHGHLLQPARDAHRRPSRPRRAARHAVGDPCGSGSCGPSNCPGRL